LKTRKTNEPVKKAAEPVKKDAIAAKPKATIPLPKSRVTKKVTTSKTTVVAAKTEVVSHKETVAAVIKETRTKHVELPADMSVDDVQHTSKKAKTQDWDDLDGPEMGDPSMVSEYVVEIFEYMKELEVIRLFLFL
jgi:G2/mitotic-specific cyclin 1/2